jgi:hypothetical protein
MAKKIRRDQTPSTYGRLGGVFCEVPRNFTDYLRGMPFSPCGEESFFFRRFFLDLAPNPILKFLARVIGNIYYKRTFKRPGPIARQNCPRMKNTAGRMP